MNGVDVIVLIVLLLNGILGAWRGFVWQALRIAALVLAFVGARAFADDAQGLWAQRFGSGGAIDSTLVWFAILAAGIWLTVSLLARLARKWVDGIHLKEADRSLGFLLGTVKGAFFVGLAFQVVLFFPGLVLPGSVSEQLNGTEDGRIKPSRAFELHKSWVSQRMRDLVPDRLEREDAPR